jgi:hypothetical protein
VQGLQVSLEHSIPEPPRFARVELVPRAVATWRLEGE